MPHQCLSSGRSDSRDLIQYRVYLRFGAERPVKFNRKAVCLVLNSRNQFKALTPAVNRNLFILIIKPPRIMVIILHHTADRDIQMQFIKYLQRNIHLTLTTIHHQQIREFRKAAKLCILVLFFQFLLLLHAMQETPCQYFAHTCIIIGSGHGFNLKLTIITAFGLSLFKHNHGTDIRKAADVGNIIGLHTGNIRKRQKCRNLLYCTDRTPFFSPNPLLVLAQNQLRISRRKFHELFLRSNLWNT